MNLTDIIDIDSLGPDFFRGADQARYDDAEPKFRVIDPDNVHRCGHIPILLITAEGQKTVHLADKGFLTSLREFAKHDDEKTFVLEKMIHRDGYSYPPADLACQLQQKSQKDVFETLDPEITIDARKPQLEFRYCMVIRVHRQELESRVENVNRIIFKYGYVSRADGGMDVLEHRIQSDHPMDENEPVLSEALIVDDYFPGVLEQSTPPASSTESSTPPAYSPEPSTASTFSDEGLIPCAIL